MPPNRNRSPQKRRPPRRPQKRQPRSRSSSSLRLGVVLAGLVIINLYVFVWRDGTSIQDVMEKASVAGTQKGLFADDDEGDPGKAAAETEAGAIAEDEAADPDGTVIDADIQSGESLGPILLRAGLTASEADKLLRALEPHVDFKTIQVGQHYRIELSDTGELSRFELSLSKLERVVVTRTADGTLEAKTIEAETEIRVEEVSGVISSSLYMSVKDAGEDMGLVDLLVDVFAYDLNFFVDQRKGDRFRVLVEKEYLGGDFLRYGRIVGAEYDGDAGTFRAFYWKQPGADKGRYYDEDGHSIEKSLLKTPLKYTRISSRFNRHRMHPILHIQRGHFGVDYAAHKGTPVWAAGDGRISFRGPAGGAGNMVVIHHDSGLITLYMHLSKFRAGQHVGERVAQKTVIGYVGETGLATGPHLHFAVKKNGHYVDPLSLKLQPGPPVPQKFKGQFEADTGAVVARLERIEPVSGEVLAVASAVGGALGTLPRWAPSVMLSP